MDVEPDQPSLERDVLSKSVICVVDDDEEVRESIGAFFRSAGIYIKKFNAADALLSWPALETMRCLITDLHMPGMSGLDLQLALKRSGRNVPVILMTAYPTEEARERAAGLDISFFVTKPTDPETLLGHVETLLEG
ncbi:response regulator transcription factor [Nguyenibacter vanlangensis]|uniref:Response regulator n=1 Tax=Nguyenibacter vanlangensis TaxID=1216886 RepID=A0A7Y7ITL2_9PROT|nr:response regulator [Nguyenibacter vanlangensis]NVN10101.1 response regulator [Nguyenibacter vanlangensis]